MLTPTCSHNKQGTADPGKKVLCSGLVVLLIGLVAGGILYCLLTQPQIISGLTPQGPIGFH
ncbi:MAG: hypothetical protein ACP5OP_01850 [Leptospirillia bacterium]